MDPHSRPSNIHHVFWAGMWLHAVSAYLAAVGYSADGGWAVGTVHGGYAAKPFAQQRPPPKIIRSPPAPPSPADPGADPDLDNAPQHTGTSKIGLSEGHGDPEVTLVVPTGVSWRVVVCDVFAVEFAKNADTDGARFISRIVNFSIKAVKHKGRKVRADDPAQMGKIAIDADMSLALYSWASMSGCCVPKPQSEFPLPTTWSGGSAPAPGATVHEPQAAPPPMF